jgi:hypothetical protein
VWIGRAFLGGLVLLLLAIGYGTTDDDTARMRVFADVVKNWQTNPEFRKVQDQYVEYGSDAMRTRIACCTTTDVTIFVRSLPGVPKDWAVNPTSLAHYTNFSKGPLSAYLHLSTEQGLIDGAKMLNDLARRENPSDEDIRNFLSGFKLYYPVVTDAGAVASVRKLIADTDGARNFQETKSIADDLRPHIAAVAREQGIPEDPEHMTTVQQRAVWQALDLHVMQSDYELWRVKQLNDWLGGVWAQVYGQMYAVVIGPTIAIRNACRAVGPLIVIFWVGAAMTAHRRRTLLSIPPRQLA